MRLIICLLVLVSTSTEAVQDFTCKGTQAQMQDSRGSLETLIFEAVRVLNCSNEYDPVFRVAMEIERSLVTYSDTHFLSLLRVSKSQIANFVRPESRGLLIAIAESRIDMNTLYDPEKSYLRLSNIYKESKYANLRALALFLRAKIMKDSDLGLAEQLIHTFFKEFQGKFGNYTGAITSMFRGSLLLDLNKPSEAVGIYREALRLFRLTNMRADSSMEPYLIHGYAAALHANNNSKQALFYLKRLTKHFPTYEGVSAAQMEVNYLKQLLK